MPSGTARRRPRTRLPGALRVNVVVWLTFVAAYIWLLRLAPERGRFVRTHVLDLVIILVPFLRPLRAFRAVRVVRPLRFVRVVAVAGRAWEGIIAGVVAYTLEPESFATVGDAIWWVLVTATTIGYGDFAPVGVGARLVAIVVMVLGFGLVGLITANIVDLRMGQAATSGRADAALSSRAGCPSRARPCQPPATGCPAPRPRPPRRR